MGCSLHASSSFVCLGRASVRHLIETSCSRSCRILHLSTTKKSTCQRTHRVPARPCAVLRKAPPPTGAVDRTAKRLVSLSSAVPLAGPHQCILRRVVGVFGSNASRHTGSARMPSNRPLASGFEPSASMHPIRLERVTHSSVDCLLIRGRIPRAFHGGNQALRKNLTANASV